MIEFDSEVAYTQVMEEYKLTDSYKFAAKIVRKLVDAGYTAFFAGGWVRDFIMGELSADIDIATNAPVDVIKKLFPRSLEVGAAFGVIIVLEKGHQFEVSTFRKEEGYDGRRPGKVELATPDEDASRRDFTINGLFYDPIEDNIYDYVHGLADMKKGLVRAIGNAEERFIEDRLRMIRAVRLTARFDFKIDPETKKAIIKHAHTLFPAVSMERVWQEFTKMAKTPRFDQAILGLFRLKLLTVIFPNLQGVLLKEIKDRVSVFNDFPKNCPTILYLMELFPDMSVEEQVMICKYLKTSGNDVALVDFVYKGKQLIAKKKVSDVEWAHFYANPHSQLCLDIIAARYTPRKRKTFLEKHLKNCERIIPHVQRIAHRKPLITGDILKKEGIPSGKLMGELLKEGQSLAIMRDLHHPKEVISLLKQSHLWPKEKK